MNLFPRKFMKSFDVILYVILCYIVSYNIIFCYIILCYNIVYCIILHHIMLYYVILNCVILYLYYIMLC